MTVTTAPTSLDNAVFEYEANTAAAKGVLALFKEAQRQELEFMDDCEPENVEPISLALVAALETLVTEGDKLAHEVNRFVETDGP